MGVLRLETVIESDGELHLANLPCHKGERIEVVLTYPDPTRQRQREVARERLMELARQSKFRSNGEYPSRDELHNYPGWSVIDTLTLVNPFATP